MKIMEKCEPWITYFEDYLCKKEGEKNWVEYWAVICKNQLLLYKSPPNNNGWQDTFQGSIELSTNTKCVTAKRKQYSFPFYVITSKARYLFKVKSTITRHKWFTAIQCASQGKPSELVKPPIPIEIRHSELYTNAEKLINCDEEKTDQTVEKGREEEIDNTTPLLFVQPALQDKNVNFFEKSDFEDDLLITNLDVIDTEFVTKRLHEIYCEDVDLQNQKPNRKTFNKTKPISYKYIEPLKWPHNSSTSLRPLQPRLTQSAETLRDVHIKPSSSHFVTSSYSQTPGDNLHDLLKKPEHILRKNKFSRHLISSAPELLAIERKNL